jgi:hypothetical protein
MLVGNGRQAARDRTRAEPGRRLRQVGCKRCRLDRQRIGAGGPAPGDEAGPVAGVELDGPGAEHDRLGRRLRGFDLGERLLIILMAERQRLISVCPSVRQPARLRRKAQRFCGRSRNKASVAKAR